MSKSYKNYYKVSIRTYLQGGDQYTGILLEVSDLPIKYSKIFQFINKDIPLSGNSKSVTVRRSSTENSFHKIWKVPRVKESIKRESRK